MSFKRKIFAAFMWMIALVVAGSVWASDKYVVPVLMYHQIAETTSYQTDAVSPRNFEWQMAFLKKHGYNVLPLEKVVEGIKQGKKFPRNSVALSFDDGYKNNYTAAFPVLQKYKLPATFFVVAGWVGREGSFSWEDIHAMHKAGMDFQSHGMDHAYLPDASPKDRRYEIQESKKILEAKLKKKIRFYAYPIGGFDQDVKTLLQDSGYEAGFTTNRGSDRLDKDLFELNRIRAGDHDTNGFVFGAKLSGYYNLFRKLKKAH